MSDEEVLHSLAVFGDFRVALATLNGKVDTVIAQMQAGDRQGEQLVAIVGDQIKFLAADTGEVKAIVRELATKTDDQIQKVMEKTDKALTTVRLDLERQIATHRNDMERAMHDKVKPVEDRYKTVNEQIEELRLWRAKVIGLAIGASALSSGIATALGRAVGG